MSGAGWDVVQRGGPSGQPLIIRDVGHAEGRMTVTNDVERVVQRLREQEKITDSAAWRRVLYYDSDGRLDEIVVANLRFAAFEPFGRCETGYHGERCTGKAKYVVGGGCFVCDACGRGDPSAVPIFESRP